MAVRNPTAIGPRRFLGGTSVCGSWFCGCDSMAFVQVLHHFSVQAFQSPANVVLDIGKRGRGKKRLFLWRAPEQRQMERNPVRKPLQEAMTNKPVAFAQKPPNPVAADCPAFPFPNNEPRDDRRLQVGCFGSGALIRRCCDSVLHHNAPLPKPFPFLKQSAKRLLSPKNCRAWQSRWVVGWLLGIHGACLGVQKVRKGCQRERGLRSLSNDHNPRFCCFTRWLMPVALRR